MRNYFTDVMDALAKRIGHQEPVLEAAYAQLVLTTGLGTTSEDVHTAWAAWRVNSDRPDHPDLLPFGELTPETQAYDDKYRDAIREVAREYPWRSGRVSGGEV